MFDRFSKDAKSSGAGDLGEWEKHTKGIGAKLLFQVFLKNVINLFKILIYISCLDGLSTWKRTW